jgi:CheY-like chemotaxis protein
MKNSNKTQIEQSFKLLVVDDDYTSRLLIRELVHKFDIEVIDTNNGYEGITLLQQHQDDLFLVLLDLRMPQISGWELVTQMRKINRDIPIIAISALPPAEICQRYHAYGFTDFIEKPIRFEDFEVMVFKYHFMACMGMSK